ncbi:hypothetical protein CRYUN_Cryun18bG0040300 [Craigia yunnanensis]
MAEAAYTVAYDSETTGEEKSSSAFPEIAIGIDIGTSQCSVAIRNGSQVELLRKTRNQKLMRSYVTFKDEIPSGGTLDIGVRPFIAALVNNVWRSTTPEEVLAIFLVELRVMTEVQFKWPIRNVVLSIPVSFSWFQLSRIERACVMAGLHVLRLMPEPTAVAFLYAQQQQQMIHDNMGSGSEKIALIFNMGAENLFSSHGISEIRSMRLLRVATQDAIQKLSFQDSVQIDVDLGNGSRICKVVKRGKFVEVNQKIFEKCEVFLDLLTIQATPLGIGIRANGNTFVPIIPRNTTMPARKELMFTTVHDNQTEVLIVVYEGEAEKAEENHLLGYFKIMGIPTASKGVPEINVCMDIDASNVLRVLAGVVLLGSQQPVVPVMEVRMPTVDDGHGGDTGINYGRNGDNLPSPRRVIDFLSRELNNKISLIRVQDANLEILEALSGTNLVVTIGVPNEAIPYVALVQEAADKWFQDHIVTYIRRGVRFRYLCRQ